MKPSIRNKLLQTSLITLIFPLAAVAIFVFIHYVTVEKYRSLTNTLTDEYRLTDSVAQIITAYNTHYLSHNLSNSTTIDTIASIKSQISHLTNLLDASIVDPEGLAVYQGLKNTINDVLADIDQGIDALNQNDINNAAAFYNSANQKYQYVVDNSTQLLQSELKYTSSIQTKVSQEYLIGNIISTLILAVIIIFCLIFLTSVSRKIVRPIEELTKLVQNFSLNDKSIKISQELLDQDDEIGVLAHTFNTLIKSIRSQIDEINQSQKALEKSNEQLETFNKFMVGRELKMIELKKTINDLTNSKTEAK